MFCSFQGTKLKCKLRVVSKQTFYQAVEKDDRMTSVFSIEYGEYTLNQKLSLYRIKIAHHQIVALARNPNLTKVDQLAKRITFSNFLTSSADYVKNQCLQRAKERAKKYERNPCLVNRFVVLHLRGTDRPCALNRITPEKIVSRIIELGVNRTTDVIYIMTDLTSKSVHFTELKKHFKNYYMFQASDMELFDHSKFAKKAAFLLYATELQLQEIADGIVETYKGHKMVNYQKILGYLAPKGC